MVTTVIPREPLMAPATTPGSVLERFAAIAGRAYRAGLVLAMAVIVTVLAFFTLTWP